mmetsp:Transcript_19075/g.59219  ORF Transcript_19075/g.59219 Transcript_19075/m.59219 type:complete len:216 (-) Transcript_19075:629-1276(-)
MASPRLLCRMTLHAADGGAPLSAACTTCTLAPAWWKWHDLAAPRAAPTYTCALVGSAAACCTAKKKRSCDAPPWKWRSAAVITSRSSGAAVRPPGATSTSATLRALPLMAASAGASSCGCTSTSASTATMCSEETTRLQLRTWLCTLAKRTVWSMGASAVGAGASAAGSCHSQKASTSCSLTKAVWIGGGPVTADAKATRRARTGTGRWWSKACW